MEINSTAPLNSPANVAQALLPDIMKLASCAITPRTAAQDRRGSRRGVDIYTLRLGKHCLLISNFSDVGNPESPPETEIEELVPVHDMLRQALEVFRGYYVSLQPQVR